MSAFKVGEGEVYQIQSFPIMNKKKEKEIKQDDNKLSTFDKIELEYEKAKKRFLKSLTDEEIKSNQRGRFG